LPRTLIEPHKDDMRYVRRKGGKFTKSQDEIGSSLAVDRRKHAKTKVRSGEGDHGDLMPRQAPMPKHQNIPHVKNVDLVPESEAHSAAPGFTSHFMFVLNVALLLMVLLTYLLLA